MTEEKNGKEGESKAIRFGTVYLSTENFNCVVFDILKGDQLTAAKIIEIKGKEALGFPVTTDTSHIQEIIDVWPKERIIKAIENHLEMPIPQRTITTIEKYINKGSRKI